MKNESSTGRGTRLKELRQAAADNPNSAKALLNLGTALMKAGFIDRAEETLRRSVELDPAFAEAWSNLGGVLLFRWDLDGCLKANQRALELKPDLVQGHYNQGLGYLYRGDTEEMVSCFRKVLEREPQNAGAHYYLAVGLNAQGEVDQAREYLDRAMALGHTPEPAFLKAMESAPLPEATAAGTGGPAPIFEIGPDSKESDQ